ncbi:MAG: UDP-N-acetylmuramoyl-tripeptide--D-alanyl-D-alanine ligase [Bacteroidota bacterium]
MKFHPKDLLQVKHFEFKGRDLLKGKRITGVSTDSRTTNAGEIFVALIGDNYDGHKFVADAFAKGAIAAVVSASFAHATKWGEKALLLVENTNHALGELALLYRRKFDIPILAVGGSNGKTTTKEMVAQVLASQYEVLSTRGNLNNHIGVPQTIFRLEKKHEIAVVEIGTNHPGELEYLLRILEPTHGLITNIGREHLEFFKSLDGVAEEEGKLFEFLATRKMGTAIINADDPWLVQMGKKVKRRTTYGLAAKRVDVRGKHIATDDTGCASLQFSGGKMKKPERIQLSIPGAHNASNALSAAAVGLAFKVPSKKIRKALEIFKPSGKRMEVLNLGGVIIFNDTYNANPDSTIAALRTLASTKTTGKKIAVLADMRELGEAGPTEHGRVGEEARALNIEYLLTYGTLAKHIHDAAGISLSVHYDQKNILAEYLTELIAPGDAVLIKGSRGMKMEDIVTFLEERLRSAIVPFG